MTQRGDFFMPKRKRMSNKKRIERFITEGRGQGTGNEYKPWILIQDVPSAGRSTRLKGIKTNRQHEFLSDMERDYFYILEYSDEVIDIREQFPLLPLEDTIIIAKELGIEHPVDPQTKEPIVMTTDFLLTKNNNGNKENVARTVKRLDDLMNKRTLEKFEIEKRYWQKRDVDWGIVTENEINKTLAQNISFIHSYYNIENIDSLIGLKENQIEDLILEYTKRLLDNKSSVREISYLFDDDMFLKRGTGISIFKYLLIRKIIQIDLFEPIDINKIIDIRLENDISMESVI